VEREEKVREMNGIVVCPETRAAKVGRDILALGGNAVDAAIAAAFVQGVENPFACGIGGGLSMYFWDTKKRRGAFLKAESAFGSLPFPSDRVTKTNEHDIGYHSVGLPGFVEGCRAAVNRWGSGRCSWEEILRPAIAAARDGVELSPLAQRQWEYVRAGDELRGGTPRLHTTAAAKALFYRADGTPIEEGDRLVQTDLAHTLVQMAGAGGQDFYSGEIGEAIAADFREHDGLITADDLREYAPESDEPLEGSYEELTLVAQPFSNGGYLIEVLQILERLRVAELGHNSPAYIDVVSKAMRAGWYDYCNVRERERVDFLPIERENVGPSRADEWASRIRNGDPVMTPDTATPVRGTTHLHCVDLEGNIVSHNHSIGCGGSGVVTEGLGFLYNNDANRAGFDERKNHPSPRRFIGAGSPLMVFHRGRPLMVAGAPGGTRIVTSIIQSVLNVVAFAMDMQTAVTVPRFHSEDVRTIFLEHTFREEVAVALRDKGNEVVRNRYHARPQGVLWRDDVGMLEPGSDPRVGGAIGAFPAYDWARDFDGRFGQGKPPH
jgi:gamma-glutamyltranspeptidase / glutathione hydrolase